MITADQLLAHVAGDYILQSHWMAVHKTKRSAVAAMHAACYGLPFWIAFRPSITAMAFIVGTHFLIDRYRLARYLVWAKNHLAPFDTIERVQVPNTESAAGPNGYVTEAKITRNWKSWDDCSATGYSSDVPAWLSVWLLIIVDNAMHVFLNGIALRYL